MSSVPGTPRVGRGGLILLATDSGIVQRVVSFQYTPDTVLRTLTPQGVGGDGGDRSEAFRLKGPPTETIKLDIEIDGTDQLAQPVPDPVTAQVGILPELAVLELM